MTTGNKDKLVIAFISIFTIFLISQILCSPCWHEKICYGGFSLRLNLNLVRGVLFYQVQNFITHFWQGMPGHIISVLECPVVVDIVAICDSILYKVRSGACSVHDYKHRREV